MKLFLALAMIFGGYVYLLVHTTDVVMSEAQHLKTQVQAASAQADQIERLSEPGSSTYLR